MLPKSGQKKAEYIAAAMAAVKEIVRNTKGMQERLPTRRITENNITNANRRGNGLLEQILSRRQS